MHISVATANFYLLPFEDTLEIIANAGFKYIELDLFWEKGKWAIAQHLKDLEVGEVIRLINQWGLKVSSIHDAGGIVEDEHSIQGFINSQLDAYLDQLGYAPGCIVFHTPHIDGKYDEKWWQAIATQVVKAAESYQSEQTSVTIENMPLFDGYYVPLTTPQALIAFISGNKLGVTLDTTHYAQIGIDIVQAARVLKDKMRTVHLSDYLDGKAHLFIGDGNLDFVGLFRVLDFSILHSITLECSVGSSEESVLKMGRARIVERLRTAKSRLHSWMEAAQPAYSTDAAAQRG